MAREKPDVREAAINGLIRLATGGIGDVARLVCGSGERDDKELAAMDLFAVSELRRGKDGGLEVKLHDRLKALELLLGCPAGEEEAGSFYAALDAAVSGMGEKSARHTGRGDHAV